MSERAYGSFDGRRDAFGRFVAVSLLGHAAALATLGLSPNPSPRVSRLPAVVEVSLVAAAPSSRRPAPKPAKPTPVPEVAKPVPPPPPPAPAPKAVALPEEPAPRPDPVPKPQAKPAPTPPRKPAQKQEPVREQAYEDVLANLRQEAGEPAPPVEVAQSEPLPGPGEAGPPSGGPGVRISAEEAAWRKRAKLHVHNAWVLAPGFRRQALETEIRVKLGPRGHVSGLRILRASGNPWYDESVERAIRKASPLPAPPAPGEWIFLFRPEDLFG